MCKRCIFQNQAPFDKVLLRGLEWAYFLSEWRPVGMSALSGLYNNRGQAGRGEQTIVYYKQEFTIFDIVLSEECLVTTGNTSGQKCVVVYDKRS